MELEQNAPTRRTLRSIIDELLERIDAAEGEVTDDVEQLELSIEQKVEAYGAVIKQWDAEGEAFETLAKAYKERAQKRDDQIARLKARLQDQLERVGCPKIKTKTVTASWRETESVEIDEPGMFVETADDRFVRHTLTPNKQRIAEELKRGVYIEGARIKTTRSLQLR